MILEDAQFTNLLERVEQWRVGKMYRGAPMPSDLWQEAAVAAKSMGVGPVARALKISPTRLKSELLVGKRSEENGHEVEKSARLVEVATINLDGLPSSQQGAPVAVLEHAETKLTLYQTLGADDIAALIRAVSGGAR